MIPANKSYSHILSYIKIDLARFNSVPGFTQLKQLCLFQIILNLKINIESIDFAYFNFIMNKLCFSFTISIDYKISIINMKSIEMVKLKHSLFIIKLK